ncbi:MAG: ATP synthase F1 subunit delta [Microscillaceae bacterium]|nr:ATP synthase F1 subunit delta [Microscillaceae bacterium]
MSEKTIAYRYAKPLMELALEKSLVDDVNRDMELLRKTCEENDQLRAILRNPIIRGYKKLSILRALFQNRVNQATMSMFEILAKHSREEILYEISQGFTTLYNEYKGIQEVTLTTTVAISESLKAELTAKLAQQLNKTIILQEKVNPELIGGFILEIGNSQIDNSVRAGLQRLKMNFIQKIYS